MHNEYVDTPLLLPLIKQNYHQRHNGSGNKYQYVHPRAGGYTGGDRPEKIEKIQRILDSRTETDNRQSTDHTERDYDISTDCQCNHCGKHSHAHKGDSKAAGVDNARIKFSVDKVNDSTHYESG